MNIFLSDFFLNLNIFLVWTFCESEHFLRKKENRKETKKGKKKKNETRKKNQKKKTEREKKEENGPAH